MKEPVCNVCHQPCSVRQIDNSAWNEVGGQTCDVGCTGESHCCRAGYQMLNLAEQIQQEELRMRIAQDGHRAHNRVLNFIMY